MIDILYKSQNILATSLIKLYFNDFKITFMSDYYNYIRIGQLFDINNDNRTVAYTGTPYYRQIKETIKKMHSYSRFSYIKCQTNICKNLARK